VSYDRDAEVYDWAGGNVKGFVLDHYGVDDRILDVGAGQGKYRELLPTYPNVDACEVWEPYVDEHDLRSTYRDVHVCDVYELVRSNWWDDRHYDLVIMGDVLEHIPRGKARYVVSRIIDAHADTVVIVPFEYPQDEEDGNVYQRHVQDDLTPELMATEYPKLQLVALETRNWKPFKGMYVGRGRG
jgi:hypothetical protein